MFAGNHAPQNWKCSEVCLGLLLSSQSIGEEKTDIQESRYWYPVHHDVVEGDWHQEEQALLPVRNLGKTIAGNQRSKDQRNFLKDSQFFLSSSREMIL